MRSIFRLTTLLVSAAALHAVPLTAQEAEESRVDALQSAEDLQAQGSYSAARDILARLLTQTPDDPDLLRRLARLEASDGRLDIAQQRIDRAAALAPQDLDVAIVRGYILFWRGEYRQADKVAQAIALRDSDYPDLAQLRSSIDDARRASGIKLRALSLGGGVSDITLQSGASRTWNTQNIVAAFDVSGKDTLALSLSREERTAIDIRGGIRLDHRISDGSVYIAGTVVKDPDFQENWSLGAGGELLVSGRIAALMDMRVADYDSGTIISLQPGIRLPLGKYFSATGRAINIFGGGESHRLGGSVRLDYQRENHPSIFALAASYPDAEAGDIRELRSVAAGVTAPISQQLSLSLAASHEDRKNSYRRWAGTLVLTYRFDQR